MAYKVLIVDDQVLPRQLFESIVESSDRYELVAAIQSAKVADAYCAKTHIDLILMDVVMADGSCGISATKRIKESYPDVKVIIVTSMPDAMFLDKARDAGADSFWYKEVQDAPMLEVMDRTMAGEHIYPDGAPVVGMGEIKSNEMTERELDVLRLLAEGLTDKEIAETLSIGLSTVRYHVNNLLSKTGFTSRTALAVYAVRSGIVVPGI
ncbi:MAG: response regulator transcription factor [Clostridia bacterium]|nr:response regulator transcription factor [Clostridia bacterium]